MLIRRFPLLLLVLGLLTACAQAQPTPEPQPLVSGQPVEREIAGGQTHTYQIALQAGQFVRFRMAQRSIDAALVLIAPNGKQLAAVNLTGAGEQESLSLETAMVGSYRLTVQGDGPATLHGSRYAETRR